MNLFLNLTTRNKLFFAFGLMVLLLFGVTAIAYRGIMAMQVSQETLYYRDFIDAVNLMEIRAKNNRVRADILNMMVLSKRSDQEKWYSDLIESRNDADKLLQQLIERQHVDQKFLGKLKELKAVSDDYVRIQNDQQIPLIYAGKVEEALAMGLDIQSEHYLNMRIVAQELGQDLQQHAENAVAETQRRADEAIRFIVIIGIIALSLAVLIVSLLARIIARPLKAFADAAGRIADGDLSVDIPTNELTDEVGRLGQSFRSMVESLRKLTLDIRDGMSILAASSAEILATMTQVAAGSEETATAVSETTATVEEVKQTVLLANQKTKQVSDSAQQMRKISQTGRLAVDELIEGMDRIREQTSSAAESIVKLSEQSQAIGEIILTVNDLAEQSNLLAVNAAIEAAKAGDQGKGFAVVAQEIKSLAEQSKLATTQVRTILAEIQKATGTAVMATDLSGKAVAAGVQQADAAGEAIRMLTESIVDAAHAALQISASSQQQLVGMDQVALAMENISQASAQNMAGTKQAEVAAQNLHELGLKLKQLVDRYKI
ncbi:MAG: methyl-accepting chemotaxis protein [Gammaproteobacteria bacterium]